ncbi:MAG: ATP-binding protein [Bacteroidota bacterium]
MIPFNYSLLFVCCLILPVPKLFSADPNIDSLFEVMESDFASFPPDSQANILHELGRELYYLEQHLEAEEYLLESMKISEKMNYRKLTCDNYYYLGAVQFWQSAYQKSVESLLQSLNGFEDILTKEDSFLIIEQLGVSYFHMGDLDMALDNHLQALELARCIGDSTYLANSLYDLGKIEKEETNYEDALGYVYQSKGIYERVGRPDDVNYCLILLGNIYHDMGDYQRALVFKKRSCEILDSTSVSYLTAYCDFNLAKTYAKLGEHDRSVDLFQKAIEVWDQQNLIEDGAKAKMYLGELLIIKGECTEGLRLMYASHEAAQKLNLQPFIQEVCHKLYQATKQCGQFEEALRFQERYILYSDSISIEQTRIRIANLQAKHELETLEIEVLQKDQRLNALYIVLLCVAIAFLALAILFVFWMYKKQKSDAVRQAEQSAVMARHNNELAAANEELKKANTELEHFAFVVSHDLKTPLRTIGSYASLINRRYQEDLDEDGRTFLRYLTEDAQYMSTLLQNILEYSRINQVGENLQLVDLNQNVRAVLRLLDRTIHEKNAIVECHTLPTIVGNDTQLLQIFQNLISNSLKFIPADRQPHIRIECSDEQRHHCFSISDNGIGIAPNLQPKIFAPFKRLHPRGEYEGTGIGLAICQKIVEQHGGRLWVESDGQIGSTFYFTIEKRQG